MRLLKMKGGRIMAKNMLDKNGNPLKGAAIWTRTISEDGGLEEHDKKVARAVFNDFIETRPEVATAIASCEREKKKKKLRVVK